MRILLSHSGTHHQIGARVAAVLLAFVFAAACGEEDTNPQGKAADAGVGTVGLDSFAPDTANSDTGAAKPDTDTTGSDIVNPCPGSAGCACADKSDCTESGQCLQTQKGKVCGALCKTGKCADGEVCTPMGSADSVDVCVPKWGSLCNPCNTNQDCQVLDASAKCIDGGDNGSFCGAGCSEDGNCPGGYECKDAKDIDGKTGKQCVVKGGAVCACNAYAIDKKLATTCYKITGSGKCTGARSCSKEGLSGCSASDPAPEECNGKDDDCNGKTDEGMCDDKNACTEDSCDPSKGCVFKPNTNPCDADGSACTVGDTCKDGTCAAGEKKACKDDVFCTTDSCDSATGNCTYAPTTGQCDDGNSCTVGDTCDGDKCIPGKAANCDDANPCTNDSCASLKGCQNIPDATVKVPCYSGNPATKGKGICVAGTNSCDAAGKLDTSSCVGEKLPSAEEACDGVDDNCNGAVDEGCKPAAFAARMGSVSINGSGKNYGTTAFLGGSQVAGAAANSNHIVQFGFYVWLKALLGP